MYRAVMDGSGHLEQLRDQKFTVLGRTADPRNEGLDWNLLEDLSHQMSMSQPGLTNHRLLEVDPAKQKDQPPHLDGLAYGPPKFFSLACIQPSLSGGETTVLDGVKLARRVLDVMPELETGASITYSNDFVSRTWPLFGVRNSEDQDPSLWWYVNSDAHPNVQLTVDCPDSTRNPEQIRTHIDQIIHNAQTDKSVSATHSWQAGDIVVIDNLQAIHCRRPFTGPRQVIRSRYGDPATPHIIQNGTGTTDLSEIRQVVAASYS